MSKEATLARRLTREFTKLADPSIREIILVDFGSHLMSKINRLTSQQTKRITPEVKFEVDDLGLGTLATLIAITRMADGETPRALALTQLYIKTATRHTIEVNAAFDIGGAKITDPQILAIGLRAARHNIIAIQDLWQTSTPPTALNRVEMSVLTLATSFLESHPAQVTSLFGPDGKNEIDQAIKSRFQRLARSTRAHPG